MFFYDAPFAAIVDASCVESSFYLIPVIRRHAYAFGALVARGVSLTSLRIAAPVDPPQPSRRCTPPTRCSMSESTPRDSSRRGEGCS